MRWRHLILSHRVLDLAYPSISRWAFQGGEEACREITVHYKSCPCGLLTILKSGKDLGGLSQSLLFHTLSQCHVLNDFGVEKVVRSYKCILNKTIIKLSVKEAAMGRKGRHGPVFSWNTMTPKRNHLLPPAKRLLDTRNKSPFCDTHAHMFTPTTYFVDQWVVDSSTPRAADNNGS